VIFFAVFSEISLCTDSGDNVTATYSLTDWLIILVACFCTRRRRR